MKLLLTSNGLSNDSIVKALFELVGKPASETVISFVPTAMNVSDGDKDWFVDDLVSIKNCGVKSLDIVDISALPRSIWLPRLESADVLFFSGGNTFHLMRWLAESGLADILPELLKTRVYAGISAGSIVASPTLLLSSKDKKIFYEENFGYSSEQALGFVNIYTRPHFNSPGFPLARKEYLEEIAKETGETIYGLDDDSALKIEGDKIEIISEGEWIVFNEK